jgi:hypothetical protein
MITVPGVPAAAAFHTKTVDNVTSKESGASKDGDNMTVGGRAIQETPSINPKR